MTLMKKLNINCIEPRIIRQVRDFLELCDEFGFYVCLETDIEMHGFTTRKRNYEYDFEDNLEWINNQPEWENAFVERMRRAYGRDKNSCVGYYVVGRKREAVTVRITEQ